MAFKLLVEKTDPSEFEYIVEEQNGKSESRLYIKGPYMMASDVNKNKRVYDLDNMVQEVTRYDQEMIRTDRAMGELNHPTTAEVDLERACHIVTEMKQDGNVFYGKSKVIGVSFKLKTGFVTVVCYDFAEHMKKPSGLDVSLENKEFRKWLSQY